VEREQAERLAAERKAAGGDRAKPKHLDKKAAAERHRAFLSEVREREKQIAAATEEAIEEALSPREMQFACDQEKLWGEASWISALNQFPNGKPMHGQFPLHLRVYGEFMEAMNKRAYGKNDDDSGNDGLQSGNVD